MVKIDLEWLALYTYNIICRQSLKVVFIRKEDLILIFQQTAGQKNDDSDPNYAFVILRFSFPKQEKNFLSLSHK